MAELRPTRILTSDILVADIITPLAGNPKLAALLEKYALAPGGKKVLDTVQFEEFSSAIEGHPVTIVPGGSSANMLTTLGKLMGSAVRTQFIGIAGEGLSSTMIRKSLEEAGIALLPQQLPPGVAAKTAVSYVILLEGGQRTIATWPGNARELLTLELISDELVRGSDALLVQGSLWHKLEHDFSDRLLEACGRFGKALWLTLPTQGQFGEDDAAHFRELIPHAGILLGNDGELMRLWQGSLEDSLAEVQRLLAEKSVAFITCGGQGAAVVTVDAIQYIAPPVIRTGDIVNTLGAGDTAFAGFVFGYLTGHPHAKSAQAGMALAGEKLHINGPRLVNPKASLKNSLPDW